MPRLKNPLTFKNVVTSSVRKDGTAKDVSQDTPTLSVSDWFNPVSPLPQNPEEARKTLVNLTMRRGEVKDFTDDEAKFLMDKYPWIKLAGKNDEISSGVEEVETESAAKAHQSDIDLSVNIDKGEL